MKRFFRKTLVSLARFALALIVLLLIFYGEEDWRGARDWATCQRELATKGESLDLRQLAPPGKPEDDLSKAPIYSPVYQNVGWDKVPINKARVELDSDSYGQVPKNTFLKGEPLDLAAWQKYYRSKPKSGLAQTSDSPARDVLQVLSQFDPELNDVYAAVSNPNACFPIDYEMPFGTRFSAVTSMIPIAKILQLKSVAHLENNQLDQAERSYLLSFRISQPLTKGCFLVNYLVIAGVRSIDDSILWEGLHRHAWTDTDLREVESALAANDMLALAADCFRIERASFLKAMDVAQKVDANMERRLSVAGVRSLVEPSLWRPRGWWDEDRVNYSLTAQKWINGLNLQQGTLSPAAFPQHKLASYIDDNQATDISLWSRIYIPLSASTIPGLENAGPTIARAETYRRLARLACRIEEYRISHGQYPDKLDDLPDLPAHLNQEVLNEQPFRYQRQGDGYKLYSLGWSQKDNGGVLAANPWRGNWPWPSP